MFIALSVNKEVADEILHSSINYAKNNSMDDLNEFIYLPDPWDFDGEEVDSSYSNVLSEFKNGGKIMLFLGNSALYIQESERWINEDLYYVWFRGKGEDLFSENVLGGDWFILKPKSELAQIKASMYDADKNGPWYDY